MHIIQLPELLSIVNLHYQRAVDMRIQDLTVLFYTLLQTGFRGEEIYFSQSWQKLPNGTVWVPPHKKGNPKTILWSQVHPLILNRLGTANPYEFYNSIRAARNFVVPVKREMYLVGEKAINLHLYRYAFIRNQFEQGKTKQQIATMLGVSSTSIIDRYLNNPIISLQ
jgi:hypothetical protein